MRRILKFLLIPAATVQPVIAVVACGNPRNNLPPASDILATAAQNIKDVTFGIKDNLKLKAADIPTDNQGYPALNEQARKEIFNYFQDQITYGASGWNYETVTINSIVAQKDEQSKKDSTFKLIQGSNNKILSTISLVANLSYKGLTAHSDTFKLNLFNDDVSDQVMISAIQDNIKTTILNNPLNIDHFGDLPVNQAGITTTGLTNPDIIRISSALKSKILNNFNSINSIANLDLNLTNSNETSTAVIYDGNVTYSNQIFQISLKNLNFELTYKNKKSEQAQQKLVFDQGSSIINILQDSVNANNQIKNLASGPQSFDASSLDKDSSNITILPNDGENITDFISRAPTFYTSFTTAISNKIKSVYGSQIKGTGIVQSTLSGNYLKNTDSNGTFNNVSFTFQDVDKNISKDINNVVLSLSSKNDITNVPLTDQTIAKSGTYGDLNTNATILKAVVDTINNIKGITITANDIILTNDQVAQSLVSDGIKITFTVSAQTSSQLISGSFSFVGYAGNAKAITNVVINDPQTTANTTKNYQDLNSNPSVVNTIVNNINTQLAINITSSELVITNDQTPTALQVVGQKVTFTVTAKDGSLQIANSFKFSDTLK